ncbi:MAG TPA: putative metallopeptidase, partial [archaeon]|nr:putative metallopeptidase [archaeon]
MRYTRSPELEQSLRQLAASAGLSHIDFSRTACVVSQGSKSRRTLARCHALPRVMQDALGIDAHYVIEIVSENFFKLGQEEQV